MPPHRGPETADEIAAAIFMECLMNLVQSAAYLLGKVSAKDTGEPVVDLARVQLVIQQLELLDKNAEKLSIEEQQLVKRSLQDLRMAYVTAAGKTPEEAIEDENTPEADPEATPTTKATPTTEATEEDEEEDEGSRKRFVKKYS
ncbi:MAG: DUF1844 domain-containing protein [Verrucomicrobiota bacterium]|nr:DUF1844 domain-containing protein [Verrucomicrobiota bacterium]